MAILPLFLCTGKHDSDLHLIAVGVHDINELCEVIRAIRQSNLKLIAIQGPLEVRPEGTPLFFLIALKANSEDLVEFLRLVYKYRVITDENELIDMVYPLKALDDDILILSKRLVRMFIVSLYTDFKEAGLENIFSFSKSWGKTLARTLINEVGNDLRKLLNNLRDVLKRSGLADIDLVSIDREIGKTVIRVRKNFECMILKELGIESGSHILRGLLCGFIEEVLDVPMLIIKEVKCLSRGDPYCEFVIEPVYDFDVYI